MNILAGKRVVITRDTDRASQIVDVLTDAGAQATLIRTTQITDAMAGDMRVLRDACARINSYQWLVIPSVNVLPRLDIVELGQCKAAAIGPVTAKVMRENGWKVDLEPEDPSIKGFTKEFPFGDGKVLLPQSNISQDDLKTGIEAKGWFVHRITAYQAATLVLDKTQRDQCQNADILMVTSPSAFRSLYSALGGQIKNNQAVVCIGTDTAAEVMNGGWPVAAIAAKPDSVSMVEAVASAF